MSYFPSEFDLVFDATTTETATGRQINGKDTYIKVIEIGSSLSTGANSQAHGISVLDQVLRSNITCVRPVSGAGNEDICVPFITSSTTFGVGCQFDATNMIINVGTGWTGTNNILTSCRAILEYTKV